MIDEVGQTAATRALVKQTRADNERNRANRQKHLKKARSGKKDPKMATALRRANKAARKKSGGLRKGWSQGRIMRYAHQLRRRM